MANLTLNWQVLDSLSLSLQGEIRSDRYRGWNSVLDKEQYYEDYDLWNLGIRYAVTDNLTLTGRVNNLLDEDFTTYKVAFVDLDGDGVYEPDSDEVQFSDDYNVFAPSRNYWLSLQWSF